MSAFRTALAVLLASGITLSQEPVKSAPLPCDAAAVEDGLWCVKCKKVKEKEQLAEEKCKDCQVAPEKIKVCVKKWIPRCGMHNQQPHLESCCKSKFCCKFEVIKSPVTFACQGCGQSAPAEEAIKHDAKNHEKKIVRKCQLSGTQPHGGEAIK